ncbi:hypothetical protein [Paraburkholderia sp. DHOC27]|uniref:hypothetical protein n=1 Tax=Paraburkholderia sp. DHOC27 TaxID=2303330 RepID=UPI000E3CB9EC|nr:hypothetical protein [Paraburkholderia sp. DHOC27]RFU44528.1 hypothetical protein D0B32_28445 [Paraburkholderia sp. DHOC27]
MPQPKIDPTKPDALMLELFSDDRWVKDRFAEHLAQELLELCESLAACFRLMPALNEAANRTGSVRTALAAAFVFGVLDDILVATKLLLGGKLPAAGNLMRQVVEGIAMAFLCSTDNPLIVREKTKTKAAVRVHYWERLDNGDSLAQGHLALRQLEWNARTLGVSGDAVARLHRSKDHYNPFSHCGTVTIASRVALEEVGMVYIGGHFDPAKLEVYRVEMNERIGLCRVLPPFMEHMLATMTPPAASPAITGQPGDPA